MKKTIILMVTVIIIFASTAFVFADGEQAIKLDGSFADWEDKPLVQDPKHDVKETHLDFLNLRYFTDNDYLYLYLERLSAKKSEDWTFNIVMVNAEKGQKVVHYPFDDNTPIYAPQFDVNIYNLDNSSSGDTVVEVMFEGRSVERTLTADDNNKLIEFRVPLSEVGLSGLNKEVEFMVKSAVGTKRDEIDWIPDGRSIIVTTGPTFYELSTIVFFGLVAFAAFQIIKKKSRTVKKATI